LLRNSKAGDFLAKRRVLRFKDRKVQSQYGTIYEMDENGRVLSETRGIKEYGRPKIGKGKSDFLGKWKGVFSQGAKKIVFWQNEYGDPAITVKGGLHPVTFGFENTYDKNKLAFMFMSSLGYHAEKHGKGYRFHVPYRQKVKLGTAVPKSSRTKRK
jgi:hypothetical protein